MADAIPSVAVSPPANSADGMDRWLGEEQLFRTAIEHTPDYAFILFDPENRVLRWNGGAEKAFGYTESEILGAPGSLFLFPKTGQTAPLRRNLRRPSGTARRKMNAGTCAKMAPAFGATVSCGLSTTPAVS